MVGERVEQASMPTFRLEEARDLLPGTETGVVVRTPLSGPDVGFYIDADRMVHVALKDSGGRSVDQFRLGNLALLREAVEQLGGEKLV